MIRIKLFKVINWRLVIIFGSTFISSPYIQAIVGIDERFVVMSMGDDLRALNDSYIRVNADDNADIRMTGSATILGLVSLPSTVQNSINGSMVLINEAGELGVGTLTVTSDLAVCGATLFASEIDPCSPTTTTSFGGSVNLPSSSTANNGSLQIAGSRFLHNYGTSNTFIGANAGNLTTTGSLNVAVGNTALQVNTTGASNTAVGSTSLASNTSGSSNTGVGKASLNKNIVGQDNTALGNSSLANVRIGTTGEHTGVGSNSLSALITGTNNTAVGYNAGSSLVLGNNNIYIGNRGAGNESNVIRLGTTTTHTACIIPTIANTTIASASTVVVDTAGKLGILLSSSRYKDQIVDINERSKDLAKLRPVMFVYKNDPTETIQYGLIAEEVIEYFPELGVYDDEGNPVSIMYHQIPALILNEYLRQEKKIEKLEVELHLQQEAIAVYQDHIAALHDQVNRIVSKLNLDTDAEQEVVKALIDGLAEEESDFYFSSFS